MNISITNKNKDFVLLRLGSRTVHFVWSERFTLCCDSVLWE